MGLGNPSYYEMVELTAHDVLDARIGVVQDILDRSDIVWPKYGNDTIYNLAERIVSEMDGR